MFWLRKLHILRAFDDLCHSSRAASELFVLCALPAAEVFVELPVDAEGKTVVDEFPSAAIGENEFCRFVVGFGAEVKSWNEILKRKMLIKFLNCEIFKI